MHINLELKRNVLSEPSGSNRQIVSRTGKKILNRESTESTSDHTGSVRSITPTYLKIKGGNNGRGKDILNRCGSTDLLLLS